MRVSKKQNEHGSIVTMYYVLTQKASVGVAPTGEKGDPGRYYKWMDKYLPKDLNGDLYKAWEDVLGKDNPPKAAEWCNTWINQALEMEKYLKKSGGLNKKWMYGWFDGGKTFKGIPGGKTTDSLTCIWDLFSSIPEIKEEFGRGGKDSWDPADTYLVSVEVASKIHPWCLKLKEKFEKGVPDGDGWKKFVGTVNARMSNLFKSNDLIPISLKKMTAGVSMSYKVTNVDPIPGGELAVVKGHFINEPYSYFQVQNRGGKCDFKGNSFLFKANIQTGAYKDGMMYENNEQYYKIEQRMQKTSNKQEVKDIRTTDQGKFKDADAQAGNVPVQKFKEIIASYAGVNNYDTNIPKLGTSLSQSEISYWADEYDEIKGSSLNFDLGDTSILGVKYNTLDFFTKLSEFDNAETDSELHRISGEQFKKDNFSAKLRNKLCNLRFMKASINANKKDELCMLLTKIYYGATKQKLKQSDLQGPFIKLH